MPICIFFFFSSRRRHTRLQGDWSSDVCSSDLPVDTHIARIALRWNLVRRTDYESIRAALERWTPPEKRKAWHLAIIAHGRTLCKARNPRCGECPVRRDCDWYQRKRAREQRTRRGVRRAATKD